jgi:hypothetical protein
MFRKHSTHDLSETMGLFHDNMLICFNVVPLKLLYAQVKTYSIFLFWVAVWSTFDNRKLSCFSRNVRSGPIFDFQVSITIDWLMVLWLQLTFHWSDDLRRTSFIKISSCSWWPRLLKTQFSHNREWLEGASSQRKECFEEKLRQTNFLIYQPGISLPGFWFWTCYKTTEKAHME